MREKALRVMKMQFYTVPSLSGDRVCMHVHSKSVEHTLKDFDPTVHPEEVFPFLEGSPLSLNES